MGFLKRGISLGAVILFLIGFSFTSTEADVYTDVVGLYKIDIKQGWNMISIPLIPLPQEKGNLETVDVVLGTVQDTDASWTPDAYKDHIFLISSSDAEGYHYRISGNTTDTLTVEGNMNSDIVAGDSYIISSIWSISEIFGDEDGPLSGGSSENEADTIRKWDTVNQIYEYAIWYYDDPDWPAYWGWYQGGASADGVKINAAAGFMLENKGDSSYFWVKAKP